MNMTVSLPDELEEFVKAEVSSGRYASASDVVREAVRMMAHPDETRITFLRKAWAEGEASGDADPADFAGIKAKGRELLKAAGK